jgi:Tfp pilus assembly protein PilF
MGRRADLLDTRALIYLKLGNRAEALADLEEAVKDSPTPARLFHLALVQHKLGSESRAGETLKRAARNGLTLAQLHPVELDDAQRLLAHYPDVRVK